MKKAAEELEIPVIGPIKRDCLSVTVLFHNDGKSDWLYSDWETRFSGDTIYRMVKNFAFVHEHYKRIERMLEERKENG